MSTLVSLTHTLHARSASSLQPPVRWRPANWTPGRSQGVATVVAGSCLGTPPHWPSSLPAWPAASGDRSETRVSRLRVCVGREPSARGTGALCTSVKRLCCSWPQGDATACGVTTSSWVMRTRTNVACVVGCAAGARRRGGDMAHCVGESARVTLRRLGSPGVWTQCHVAPGRGARGEAHCLC